MSSALISSADASRIPIPAEDEDVAALRHSVVAKLTYAVGRDPIVATDWDWFMAAALAVRDHVLERWLASTRTNYVSQGKRVYYLSLEFLIGRLLHDSLNNLGLVDRMRAALAELGVDYDRLRNVEHDAALGNGGLGRLAACFMESMATLRIAAHGYGIRYDHGMFRQVIKDGWQQEYPENWLTFGNPWEVARPDATHRSASAAPSRPRRLPMAPSTTSGIRPKRWMRSPTTRRWSAGAATTPTRCGCGRRGQPTRCGSTRSIAATMSARWSRATAPTPSRRCCIRATRRRPGRNCGCGRSIFFTSASLQDLVGAAHAPAERRHPPAARQGGDPAERHASGDRRRRADAHPGRSARTAVGRGVAASPPTRSSYTNHTLLPEALESWPVSLMERLLPRHMQIVYQINRLHLDAVCASPRTDGPPLAALSLIDDNAGRRVRMSSLAFLGSHKVNGVSALHTELMRQTVFRDLHQLYPERIVNKTNGITFRRWLFAANPRLTRLLTDVVGERVLDDRGGAGGFRERRR